jgi:hypothetical protein
MPRDHHGKARSRKAGDTKQRGRGTCTGAEQVLGLESCSGQIRRGGMTGRVHPSAVRKRERVSWARLVLGRAKEDCWMGWKHRQRENELDVP